MKHLDSKVAVVTGAASGIGRELALALAKEGCHLALCDVDPKGLDETLARIGDTNRKVTSRIVNMADREAVYQFRDKVLEQHGKVHILVNNAGVALTATIEDMEYEDFTWLMDINFWGMVYGTKAFLPHMKQHESHIANISSVCGLWAVPGLAAYNCSKFAIRGFTEALSQELAGTGVSVSSVHPGAIRTNIVKNHRFISLTGGIKSKEQAVMLFNLTAMTTAERAAKVIVKGIKKDRRRILIGIDARFLDFSQRIFPSLYQNILPTVMRFVR